MKKLLVLMTFCGSSSLFAQIPYSQNKLFQENETVRAFTQAKVLPFKLNDNKLLKEVEIEIKSLDNMPVLIPQANDNKISVLTIPSEEMPNPLFKSKLID